MRRLSLTAALCLLLASCRGDPPAPPDGGTGDIQVSGGERLGWMQQASDAAELNTFQYAVYVDGTRSELTGASCAGTAGAAGFECSAPLPPLTPGSHLIELATFIVEGSLLESARSSPLRVTLTALATPSVPSVSTTTVVTADAVPLRLELVADGLSLPSDLAFAPDGSILIAERAGAVRVVRGGALSPRAALDLSPEISLPEGGLLAIAIDPGFHRGQIVYALYATRIPGRTLAFTLARYRDVADTFGERAVLLDRIPASDRSASGALRVGPDGKLYVGLDDAGDPRNPGGMGSFNGKVLRLNADGTTPDDQAGHTPIYSLNHSRPTALDWQPSTGELWVVDALPAGRLTAVMIDDAAQKRGTARVTYAMPPETAGLSAVFYRGALIPAFRDNLFVAAGAGRHLIRMRFDPQDPARIVSSERLLLDQLGTVRVVAAGPDGALYVCNDTALFRLLP